MQPFPPTIVIRHQRENLKKCSLRGLEERSDFSFLRYPDPVLPALENYVMLSFEGPLLSEDDATKGILVLDGTWRYAEKMEKYMDGVISLPRRSLPSKYRTAYPRRQEGCVDPERGLASVEAIYIAYSLMGRNIEGLIDHYYWKDAFLELNFEF